MLKENIIQKIKRTIKEKSPDAMVILYGSFAKGKQNSDSDIDILILLKKDKISLEDEHMITYPLYDIEFDTGQIISPLVLSQNDWETRHRITPFYENIKEDGIVL